MDGVFVSKRLRGDVDIVPSAAAQLRQLVTVRRAGLARASDIAETNNTELPPPPSTTATTTLSTLPEDLRKDRVANRVASTTSVSGPAVAKAGAGVELSRPARASQERPKDRAVAVARAALDSALAETRVAGGETLSREAYKAVLRAIVHDIVGSVADVANEDDVARLVGAHLAMSALSSGNTERAA